MYILLVQEALTQRNRVLSRMAAVYSTCTASLSPSLKLGQSALLHISKLAATFAADPTGYFDFINTYGTHYVEKAKYGGQFLFTAETDMSYFQNKSSQQVEANVKATFANVLSVGTGVQTESSKEVAEFEKSSLIISK